MLFIPFPFMFLSSAKNNDDFSVGKYPKQKRKQKMNILSQGTYQPYKNKIDIELCAKVQEIIGKYDDNSEQAKAVFSQLPFEPLSEMLYREEVELKGSIVPEYITPLSEFENEFCGVECCYVGKYLYIVRNRNGFYKSVQTKGMFGSHEVKITLRQHDKKMQEKIKLSTIQQINWICVAVAGVVGITSSIAFFGTIYSSLILNITLLVMVGLSAFNLFFLQDDEESENSG